MITIETKLGDTVTGQYGDTGIVVGVTDGGNWWIVRDVVSGRECMARRITADTVVIVGQPIEGGN